MHALYPDYYGVAVAQQPDLSGEFTAHRNQNVTLTFADGRRILVATHERARWVRVLPPELSQPSFFTSCRVGCE